MHMATTFRIDYTRLLDLWRTIEQAGGRDKYIIGAAQGARLPARAQADRQHEQGASSTATRRRSRRRRPSAGAWPGRPGRPTRRPTSSTSARGCSGTTTSTTTSGTCPTPRSARPRTSCRRSTSPGSSPRPWGSPSPSCAGSRTTATRPRGSTTAASRSPSATARAGRSGPRPSASRPRSGGSCATSSSACRSTARPTGSSPAGRSPPTPTVHADAVDRAQGRPQGLLPDRHPAARQGRVPQGRLPRADRHAAGAALHRGAARDRPRSTARRTTSRSAPAACRRAHRPARRLTNTLCLRLDRRLHGAGEQARLAVHALRRRPDVQPPERPQGQAAARQAARLHQRDRGRRGLRGPPREDPGVTLRRAPAGHRPGRQRQGGPRVPREIKREIRAALHNLGKGKPLREGETLSRLAGMIAFITMTDRKLGQKLRAELDKVQGAVG